jgi:hypothetical protein
LIYFHKRLTFAPCLRYRYFFLFCSAFVFVSIKRAARIDRRLQHQQTPRQQAQRLQRPRPADYQQLLRTAMLLARVQVIGRDWDLWVLAIRRGWWTLANLRPSECDTVSETTTQIIYGNTIFLNIQRNYN